MTPAQIIQTARTQALGRLAADPGFGYLPDPASANPLYGPLTWGRVRPGHHRTGCHA